MPKRVIVIGAGWSGLAAAKTYLQINPSVTLTILDADTSVGGVWSLSRLYPGLVANSPNGLYEFSDLSMVTASQPVYYPVPGKQVQAYLHQYAEKFDLLSRIRFGCKVVKAERISGGSPGWRVYTNQGDVLECEKLIVATGLHSKPHWPEIPRGEEFKGFVMHSKSLGQEHHRLTTDGVRDVVVVGGCKSAVEASNIALQAGKRVHWVVRENVQGVPLIVIDPHMRPNLVAVNNTRIFSAFSPSMFATSGFWYNFLHSGKWFVGNVLLFLFWNVMSFVVTTSVGYGKSENGRKIKPQEKNLFRSAPYISVVHNTNPFLNELHSGKNLTVYRSNPTKLVKGGMKLDTGEVLKADVVVYCTGWLSTIDFFYDEEAAQLGIPVPHDLQDVDQEKFWANMEDVADTEVTQVLPELSKYPKPSFETGKTHSRLYRQVLSPKLLAEKDRSITFVGMISSSQTSFASELSALWAAAWMEDIYPRPLPTEAQMEKDVAKVNAWMARRYGARGQRDPEIILEIQTYFDLLMEDLGLRVKRKQKGLFGPFAEWLLPYQASDYKGIVDEFLAKVKPDTKIC